MATQTFRAPDVMTALEEVQRQLGPEAIIVSVQQVQAGPTWQVWRKPEVEVVAMPGKPPAALPPAAPAPAAKPEAKPAEKTPEQRKSAPNVSAFKPAAVSATKPATKPGTKSGTRDQAAHSKTRSGQRAMDPAQAEALRRLTEKLRTMQPLDTTPPPVAKEGEEPREAVSASSLPPSLQRARQLLLEQEVDTDLIEQLTTACAEMLSPRTLQDEARLRDYLKLQLAAYLRARPANQQPAERVICLIGMSGSGKTSVSAKLAAHYSQGLGRKVSWICADTVGAGAISEARMFTEAFGIPLHIAYTPDELESAVNEEKDADLVIVDTPGCNPYRESNVIELGDYLAALPGRSTYLVVPATYKEKDLNKALASFRSFNLKGLVITRMDSTGTYGNVLNLAWRSQLPLAHFSTGPRIPDDLRPASPALLVSALFGEEWMR